MSPICPVLFEYEFYQTNTITYSQLHLDMIHIFAIFYRFSFTSSSNEFYFIFDKHSLSKGNHTHNYQINEFCVLAWNILLWNYIGKLKTHCSTFINNFYIFNLFIKNYTYNINTKFYISSTNIYGNWLVAV